LFCESALSDKVLLPCSASFRSAGSDSSYKPEPALDNNRTFMRGVLMRNKPVHNNPLYERRLEDFIQGVSQKSDWLRAKLMR